jgi:hypothetical protein
MSIWDWGGWPWNWGSPDAPPVIAAGELLGRVEIISGVPAAGAHVRVIGQPRSSNCDSDGIYDLKAVSPGQCTLSVSYRIAETGETLTATPEGFASNPGEISLVPTIVLSPPLPVAGRVNNVTAANCEEYYVGVPALHLAAPLSSTGTFVLNGLPPGRSQLVLSPFNQSLLRRWPPRYRGTLDVDVRTGPVQFFEGLEVPPQ